MKINKKFEVETRAAQTAPTSKDAAEALKIQYEIVVKSEAATFRERVKFGAMLIQWSQYLGEGRGHGDSEGLKGWLEENCPEIGYASAMAYKGMAERAIKMLGGGQMATAALMGDDTVRQPDGETVDVESEYVEKADALFEKADSRRKLEQMWFEFTRSQGGKKPRAPLPLRKLSKQEEAKVIWTGVMNVLDKSAVMDSVPLLPGDIADVCLERVTALRDALKERVAEED
jgi:hypothetical protein